jgi:cell division protein FtsB
MKKQVQYNGFAQTLNSHTIYDAVEEDLLHYKIRNDLGRLEWYRKSNFVEVKRKVSKSEPDGISNDPIKKIEKELKDTEQRMADLRQQLELVKNPPTKNILLRATRKNPDWVYDDEVAYRFDDLTEALNNGANFPKGLAMHINMSGDGIALDNDYRWELIEDDNGIFEF